MSELGPAFALFVKHLPVIQQVIETIEKGHMSQDQIVQLLKQEMTKASDTTMKNELPNP